MSQLLGATPHSHLICLEFPTNKPPSTGGPPFSSPPEAYKEHLIHPGEKILYDDDGFVQTDTIKGTTKGGLVQVAHWQPKTTHAVGMDEHGTVSDFVALWRHR
jgi:hypothetical protein